MNVSEAQTKNRLSSTYAVNIIDACIAKVLETTLWTNAQTSKYKNNTSPDTA